MEQILRIAQVILPILAAVALGMFARRKAIMSEQDVKGLQQFVMKFGLPCVIFNSCLTADIGAESLTSMVLVLPSVLLGTLWAFRARKSKLPYHNLPQLFCAQETGMLGIPLFMILFGVDQAYRMGILDLTQSVVAIPVIAILSSDAGANPTPSQLNTILTINADFYVPIDENSIPTGEIRKVEGTPFDFRTPKPVGQDIAADDEQIKNGTGYDHCYVLNKKEVGELSFAAKVTEPVSGRTMEVYTTEPGVQVYTSNWHSGFAGAHGATFPKRSAICFEAQHFPDSPNRQHFPSVVLCPGETYKQVTVYKFGVEK